MGFLWGWSRGARGVDIDIFFSQQMAHFWTPPIVTERNLQISLHLGAMVGTPGAKCKILKHVDLKTVPTVLVSQKRIKICSASFSKNVVQAILPFINTYYIK